MKKIHIVLCCECKYATPHPKYANWIKCAGRLNGRIFSKDFFCKAGREREDHA
ncbi:MAG: hypothetical protein AAGU74_08395 [Bacillota bacterium]